jgi:tetratricopeptide (TPR) repeat protein
VSYESHDGVDEAIRLARAYVESRNYQRAVDVLQETLYRDPQNPGVLIELAQAQLFLGEFEAAERSARGTLRSWPSDCNAMRICAGALGGQSRWREALALARQAVDGEPYEPANQFEYARLLARSGDYAGAEPVAAHVLQMMPHSADAHVLMGGVLTELGRRTAAAAAYERALRLEPGHAGAIHARAYNDARGGRLSSALNGFQQAGALDPAIGDDIRAAITETIRVWLSWVTIGAWVAMQVALRTEQFDDAAGPSTVARLAAGAGAVILLGVCGWVARSLPLRTWRTLMGAGRELRTLKIYIGLCALVVVTLSLFALGGPVSVGLLMVVTVVTVAGTWIAPAIDRARLSREGVDRDQDPYREWNRES